MTHIVCHVEAALSRKSHDSPVNGVIMYGSEMYHLSSDTPTAGDKYETNLKICFLYIFNLPLVFPHCKMLSMSSVCVFVCKWGVWGAVLLYEALVLYVLHFVFTNKV